MPRGRLSAKFLTLTACTAILATTGCTTITGTGDHTPTDGGVRAGVVPAGYAGFVAAGATTCPGLSPALLAAQIKQESNWDPRAVSRAGARGLSQFMPGTWRELGRDANGNGVNSPNDPADAIDAQSRYMCQLLNQAASYLKTGRLAGDPLDLALAAYNAGMGRVLAAGGNRTQLPLETQKYVAVIRMRRKTYTASGDALARTVGSVGTGNTAVVRAATRWTGTPYVYGGGELERPSGVGRDGRGPGWDCSSLTRHAVWLASGRKLELPRRSTDQARTGRPVRPVLASMAPGDLIAFSIHGGPIDHIGVYAGNGTMIHAPRTGKNVEQADLTDTYWSALPWTVRRVL